MPVKKSAKKSAPKKKNVELIRPREIQIKHAAPAASKNRTGWFSSERITIYVYWFIILFFVSATFYILGRSQEFMRNKAPAVEINGGEVSGVNALDYLITGKSKLLSGDIQGAIYDLGLSIGADENIAESYIYRGEAFMQLGDAENAIADFNKAIDLKPDSAVAYYDRAILNARSENYPAAFADINNAIAANENGTNGGVLKMSDIYSKRAQFNIWSKNWMAAIVDYTTAIDGGSNDANDYAGRAEAQTALGQYSEATEDYLLAVKLISEQINGAPSAGEREMMSRQAITYFEKSAACRVQLADFEGAKSDLQSAITISDALGDTEQVQRLRALESAI